MSFQSWEFSLFVAASLCGFYLFRRTPYINYLWGLSNITFLLTFDRDWIAILPLLSFLCLGFLFSRALRARKSGAVFWSAFGIILALFLYLRKYSLVGFMPYPMHPFLAIGISYMLFRTLHMMIDVRENLIQDKIKWLDFFNYNCFFLSLVSGPVERFQDFQKKKERATIKQLSEQEVATAFSRFIKGYFKIIVLGPIVYADGNIYSYPFISTKIVDSSLLVTTSWMSAAMFTYTFYLYLNFSGYMDIVIGIAKLFCIDLEENFNKPFQASTFLDFWNRWHITLSQWFKTYVFNPLSKALLSRWSQPGFVPYAGVIAFFLCFFIMGIWHGTTIDFVFYGLMVGLGASVNKMYQVNMKNFLGKNKYDALRERTFYNYFSRGLTLGYFSTILCVFWGDVSQRYHWLSYRVLMAFLLSFVILTFIYGGLFFLMGVISPFFKRWAAPFGVFKTSFPRIIVNAVMILIISYFVLNRIHTVDRFVYQAF